MSPAEAEKRLTQRVDPVFSEEVKATGISGNVYVNYTIDQHGNAVHVVPLPIPLLSPARNPKLIAAVLSAIKQWKFEPYVVGGQPIEVETYAVINFDFSRHTETQNGTGIRWERYDRPSVRLSMDVAAALLIHKVEPIYPPEALEKKLEGDVVLAVGIDQDGYTQIQSMVKGDPIFEKAAKDAVRQWRYKPYTLRGEPVPAVTTVKISFHM